MFNISERNKLVAMNHWKKVLDKQKSMFLKGDESGVLKARICGFLAGDGSVKIRKDRGYTRYDIDFFPDDKSMLQEYIHTIQTVYQKTPNIREEINHFNVRFTSKTIVTDLCEYASFGIHKWTFPRELFKIKGAKEEWLRAFFSAEAYVNSKVIRVQTTNIDGMKQLCSLLNGLDIKSRYHEYIPKNKNYSKVGIVIIGTKEARTMYYNKIGFYHSRKTDLLKKSLSL